MPIDGNATAVVDHRNGVVDVDRDVDLIAEASQRFVDRVVHDLVNEMVQTGGARRPDVHGGPFPNGLEAFENLDLVRAVVVDRAAAVRASVGRRAVCRLTFRLVGFLVFEMLHVCPLLLPHLAHQMRMGMIT